MMHALAWITGIVFAVLTILALGLCAVIALFDVRASDLADEE